MNELEKWYDNLRGLDQYKVMSCVNYYGKWPKGTESVYYRGMAIYKRQFDWIKRNMKHNWMPQKPK